MAVEIGDYNVEASDAIVLTETSDGTGSKGDAVTIDGSDRVSQYTTDADDFYGFLTEDSPSAGEDVAVLVHGDVVVSAGGSLGKGDLFELDGATNGRVVQNASGTEVDVDEGGTATYTIAAATGKCLIPSGGTTSAGDSLGTNEGIVYVY